MFTEAAIVLATLGAPMAPADMTMPTPVRPVMNSVQFYDRAINVTNRVLNRTIRTDIVRVHTNMMTGEVDESSAKRNLQMVEEHCKIRLWAAGILNAGNYCGAGKHSQN